MRIGIDLVSIARIRRLGLENLDQFYTPEEIAYCLGYSDPFPHLAGRLAVKEAVLKALGTGWTAGFPWLQISTVAGEHTRPVLQLSGEVADQARKVGVVRTEVSISHEAEIAVAQVLFVTAGPGQ